MTLSNDKHKDVKMYLDHTRKRIPIPRYVYKIVEGTVNKQGTDREVSEVYIVFNNPYVWETTIKEEVGRIFGVYERVTCTENDPIPEPTSDRFNRLTKGCVPKGFAFKKSLTDFEEILKKLYPNNEDLKAEHASEAKYKCTFTKTTTLKNKSKYTISYTKDI